jgi:hypothetical protein
MEKRSNFSFLCVIIRLGEYLYGKLGKGHSAKLTNRP